MLELNKFYIGESVKFMKENIKDNFIDLTVTSPPYDDLRSYNGFVFDYKAVISELYRVTKEGGIVVWVVNDKTISGSESGTSFKQALYAKEIGFNLHDTMIYAKNNVYAHDPRNKRYKQCLVYVCIYQK
jgi:site-specific DNA-methyltransferase (adenine-specific)